IEVVTEMRAETLRETVRLFSPDLLVADFMPAGPYGELLPALDELERCGGGAVAGFRDIVDEPGFVRELWRETGVYDVLRARYSGVCVYGDPSVLDFAEYGLDAASGVPVHYFGYLGRPGVGVGRAECVVGSRGDNTVCDVLSWLRPAVLVPGPGRSLEQALRADRLEEWQVAEVVRPGKLTSRSIAQAVERALSREEIPPPPVSLDGLGSALDFLDTTLAQARAA